MFRRSKIRNLVIAGASLLILPFGLAAPASAQTTVYHGSSAVLSVPVTATVGGICGFAPNDIAEGSYDAGAIDTTAWQNDFTFTLRCTGPSRLAIVSSNGGLETTPEPTDAGYIGLAPYDVDVHIVHNSGTADSSCTAAALEASSSDACALRGTASPTVGMFVPAPSYDLSGSYLRVSAPAYPGPSVLVSGAYGDTLTVTVSPAS